MNIYILIFGDSIILQIFWYVIEVTNLEDN